MNASTHATGPTAPAPAAAEAIRVTIAVSEGDEACLWADSWRVKDFSLTRRIEVLAEQDAANYRRCFPMTPAQQQELIREYRAAIPRQSTPLTPLEAELLASLREARDIILIDSAGHADVCAAINALVPCDCWLGRAERLLARLESEAA